MLSIFFEAKEAASWQPGAWQGAGGPAAPRGAPGPDRAQSPGAPGPAAVSPGAPGPSKRRRLGRPPQRRQRPGRLAARPPTVSFAMLGCTVATRSWQYLQHAGTQTVCFRWTLPRAGCSS